MSAQLFRFSNDLTLSLTIYPPVATHDRHSLLKKAGAKKSLP
jgi:hypothetical protein